MESSASKECGICNNIYNEEMNCPRILPCFHCFCSYCIDQLISMNKKSCPFCRVNFQAQSANEFSINTNLLDIMKYVAELERRAESGEGEDTSSLNKIWKENEEISNKNLADCKEATNQIENALRTNLELKDKIMQLNGIIKNQMEMELKEIEAKNTKQIRSIEQSNDHLRNYLDNLVIRENEIKETNAKLKAARSFTDAAPVHDNTKEFNRNFQESLKVLQEFISKEESERQRIGKSAEETHGMITLVQEILSAAKVGQQDVIDPTHGMAAVAVIHGDTPEHITSAEENHGRNTLMQDMLSAAKGGRQDVIDPTHGMAAVAVIHGDTPEHVTIDNLQRMSRSTPIMGYQDLPGRGRRYARVTFHRNNLVCLHHLKEEIPIPSNVCPVKFDDLMNLVDISRRRIFLELGVGEGRYLGRILIRLYNNENYQRNFSLLCTGEMGPSYCNSNIIGVWHKGDNECENVRMGDYEKKGGTGGKAMVEVVNWPMEERKESYKKPHVEGTVMGLGGDVIEEANASQFGIFTKGSPGNHLYPSIGIIDSGLNVLTEAISNYPNITDIKILDCGIVLSH